MILSAAEATLPDLVYKTKQCIVTVACKMVIFAVSRLLKPDVGFLYAWAVNCLFFRNDSSLLVYTYGRTYS